MVAIITAQLSQPMAGGEALPAEAFPASLELELAHGIDNARSQKLVDQIKAMSIVEDFHGFDPSKPDDLDTFAMPKGPSRIALVPLGN